MEKKKHSRKNILLNCALMLAVFTCVFQVSASEDNLNKSVDEATNNIEEVTSYVSEGKTGLEGVNSINEETTFVQPVTTSVSIESTNGNAGATVEKAIISKIIPNNKGIKIYWTNAKNATRYYILRSDALNGNYTMLTSTAGTYYNDVKVQKGKKYYYKIQSVGSGKDNTVISAAKSGKIQINFKIKLKKKKGAYYISWKKIPNADGYEIRVSSKKKGKYSVLKRTGTTTYCSYKLINKKKKYYKIVPYYVVNGKRVYGQKSETKKIKITRVKLKVDFINQYPELPTGCEATALTMVLNYNGFSVKKETIARTYMEKQSVPGDFYNYFLGDPFSKDGLGIYAPGLTTTANKYLSTKNTKLKAYDITGAGIEKICKYVSEGHPVCIWTTYNLYTDPKVVSTWKIDGKTYYWKTNEHCMTVIGFDKKKDTIIIANPARGITEYPINVIEKRNKQYNEMAVVIK